MTVFYADFDKENDYNSILKPLKVDRDIVMNAVDKFLEFINKLK